MKRFKLFLALLLSVCVAKAQYVGPDPITPASKGTLPEMPVIEEAPEGQFGGLCLLYTTLAPFQGANWDYEAELSFPSPQSLGGNSYSLQVQKSSGWETYNESAITGTGYIVSLVGLPYRLKLHGGEKDGWVSNVVKIPAITIPSQKKYSQTRIDQYTFVGSVVYSSSLTIRVYHDHSNFSNYTDYKDDSSFKRTWYRRNPNTGAMTSTGGHDKTYTVTLEDVGYEIVEVVEGDKVKADFYYSHTVGLGKFPVFSSAEYFYEGFIVNTEYDIPNPETVFGLKVWNEELGVQEVQPFVPSDFKVLAPGRYAINYPWTKYNFEYLYSTNPLFGICELSGSYVQPLYLWCGGGGLETNALQNGQVVEGAKVNLLEKNMEGNMQYVYTSDDGYLTAASGVAALYAKAVNVGDGNLPTYYPNALLWTDAKSFSAMEMFHSETGPQSIDIEVQRAFAPLGGQGTIEGKIDGTLPVPTPLLANEDPSIIGTWNFYMTDENGEPIHTDDMLRVQVTFNEDGTYVMNIPVWGEVQSGNWSWWTTGQTLQFQVTKLVKGVNTYEGESLLDYWGVTAEDDRVLFRTDISFDVYGNLIMDIFGLPGSVYEKEGAVKSTPEPVYVYLRKKGGEIIAAVKMQDDGSYRFTQVPYGTYEVIPNIDGYTVQTIEAMLTEAAPAATAIDYVVGDYVIRPAGASAPGDVNGDNTVDVADIANIIDIMAKGTNNPQADVNGDGTVDVADIAAIIDIMAKN